MCIIKLEIAKESENSTLDSSNILNDFKSSMSININSNQTNEFRNSNTNLSENNDLIKEENVIENIQNLSKNSNLLKSNCNYWNFFYNNKKRLSIMLLNIK